MNHGLIFNPSFVKGKVSLATPPTISSCCITENNSCFWSVVFIGMVNNSNKCLVLEKKKSENENIIEKREKRNGARERERKEKKRKEKKRKEKKRKEKKRKEKKRKEKKRKEKKTWRIKERRSCFLSNLCPFCSAFSTIWLINSA